VGFFSDFFGGSARKDLRNAKSKSDAALAEGYEGATGRYDEAYDLFTPYAEQGQQANQLYGHAIGLGTDEEREAAQSRFFSDPAMQSILGDQSNALLRQLNARGNTYGGKAALAGARVGRENYEGWLNRLMGQGQQGGQFAGQQAGVRMGQGDLDFGYGATRAGNEINYGNAQAANRSTGVNNLLNVAGTAAKAAAAFSDIRLKRDVEEIGALPSGLPVYEFAYIWGPERHIGVMAHEAERIFPEAVSYSNDGFAMVDYAQIG
jgi:hypothetical protein